MMLAQEELTQEEALILGLEGKSEEELRHFRQLLENWDYGTTADFKILLPCIQNKREFSNIYPKNIPAGHCRTWVTWRERPFFENDRQRVYFLQLLRQMRLAWKVVSSLKDEPSKTNIFDALARYEKNKKYWNFPEFLKRTNKWSSLNRKIVVGESNNSAFNKIYYAFSAYIRGERQQGVSAVSLQNEGQTMENTTQAVHIFPKNIILYGSPGTGKTYKTVQYAVAIVENRSLGEIEAEEYSDVAARYREYRDAGRICFITFHQSYEYEEFIEGLRPRLADEDGTNEGELSYEIHDGVFKCFCRAAEAMPVTEQAKVPELAPTPAHQERQNFVFIIDEINRGNMSKIFGELMTLIEESKRLGAKEEMRARLPYTGDYFGVPGNVFIIGTMNTADRSIALMDVALRRRFSFIAVPPEPGLLEGTVVAGIHINVLLDLLNRRIEALLDREHVVGHSVFLALREKTDLPVLAAIMSNNILPLLQEYFYDDYEKIRLVLGDNQKTQPGEVKFIEETDDGAALFGPHADAGAPRYSINPHAFANPVAYRYLGLRDANGKSAGTSQQGFEGHEAAQEDEH